MVRQVEEWTGVSGVLGNTNILTVLLVGGVGSGRCILGLGAERHISGVTWVFQRRVVERHECLACVSRGTVIGRKATRLFPT